MEKEEESEEGSEEESGEADDPMEVDDTSSCDSDQEALEKVISDKGKNGPRSNAKLVTAKQVAREAELKEKLQEALKKAKAEALEKAKETKKMVAMPVVQQLDIALEKARPALEKEAEKYHICVDWHNTLEKDEDVSAALAALLQVCKVHIISAADSQWRHDRVLRDIERLPLVGQLASYHAIWQKWGPLGKVDWCCHLGITVIFDDHPKICKEGREWGLEVYPVRGKQKHHGESWATFAEAVVDFLHSRSV